MQGSVGSVGSGGCGYHMSRVCYIKTIKHMIVEREWPECDINNRWHSVGQMAHLEQARPQVEVLSVDFSIVGK